MMMSEKNKRDFRRRVRFFARFFVFSCAVILFDAGYALTYATDFKDEAGSAKEWDFASTTFDSKYGRKFSEDGDCITSPLYDADAVSFSLSARTFQNQDSFLVVSARKDLDSQFEEIFQLWFTNNSETNETVRLARGNHYRQFRLTFRKTQGTLRVCSFSVACQADGEVAIPFDLSVKDVGEHSFTAAWTVDEMVDSFLFDCWTTSLSPWSGDVVWREDFAGLDNKGGLSNRLQSGDFDDLDCEGWSGEWLYVPPDSSGVVQVGKASDVVGYLQTPSLSARENVGLVVRACAHKLQPNRTMSVFCVRAGQTNEVASFELTESFEDYCCSIPEVVEGDSFLFRSFTTGEQRKVLIDDVAFVSGFRHGVAVTNYVHSSRRVEYSPEPIFLADGLSPGVQYDFAVRAVSAGKISEFSSVYSVNTKKAAPADLAALPLSALQSCRSARVWFEDFSSLADVFQGDGNVVDWLNMLTIHPWQAYEGERPFQVLVRNHGKGTASGLYAYLKSDGSVESYCLGTLTASGKDEYVFGLSFKNDTPYRVDRMSISYDAVQFGFRNTDRQELVFEYRVSDVLEPLTEGDDWKVCDALVFCTTKDSESGMTSGSDVVATPLSASDIMLRLPPGAYCHIRWRRESCANAAAMAIDNFSASFDTSRSGLRVVVR